MKDWIFTGDEFVCDLRVAGVLVKGGKIYVQHERDGHEYALPGGHVRIGETTTQALIREYKEESGADICCKNLLWTEECFWEWNGKMAHNITFYYRIELCDGCDLTDHDEFVPQEDNGDVVMGWLPINEIKNVTIYPEFIRQTIYELDAPSKHFITHA